MFALFKIPHRVHVLFGKLCDAFIIVRSQHVPVDDGHTGADRSHTVLQGNLNDIKRSYGRVNLRLKVEKEVSDIISAAGARIVSEKEFEYEIKVSGEAQANDVLRRLIAGGVSVIAFELREPTLHEIFVEKVENQDAKE